MMDPTQLKIEQGQQAKALLASPIFQTAIDGLLQRYVDCWVAAQTVEAREDAHRFVRIIAEFKQDLQSFATTGDLHLRRLDDLQGVNNPLNWRLRDS